VVDQTSGGIVISATPEQIMDVIADLESYPSWSEGMKAAEILESTPQGRPAVARLNFQAGGIKDEYLLAYTWDGEESVSWTLQQGTILKAQDGSYTLTDNGDGTVQVEYALVIELSIPMIGMIRKRAEKQIIKTALEGLKKRVESL